MPKKSVNLSEDAIGKVETKATTERRNFSNMLETIVQQYFNFHSLTNAKMTKEEIQASLGITIVEENG